MKDDNEVMKDMKLDFNMLDSGCCGMAGYFGYEAGAHYDVGKAAGERVLLPAVRKAEKDTIIIADGFSCREQIEQETNRKGLHIAQVMQMALNNESPSLNYPEKKYVDGMKLKDNKKDKIALAVLGVAAIAVSATLIGNYLKKRKS